MKKTTEPPLTPTAPSRRRSSSSATEDTDQYGLSQLFQPDNAPRGVMATVPEEGSVKMEDTSVRTKFKVAPIFSLKIDELMLLCVPKFMKICSKRVSH